MTEDQPRLQAIPGEADTDWVDQVMRKRKFLDTHPEVTSGFYRDDSFGGSHHWASFPPVRVGDRDVDRVADFTLKGMLDQLDRLFPPDGRSP